jgi:NAD(P)H-hydrate epimerase
MRTRTIDRQTARDLDRRAVEEFGLASIVLMENAGRGVADELCQLGIDGRVVICCGPGNNGGDGFVIARHLDLRGFEVEVYAWCWPEALIARGNPGAPGRGDAAINLTVLQSSQMPVHLDLATDSLAERFHGVSWIVDALLGTGSRGEPRAPLDAVIDAINASGVSVLAVDLPSGLDCDTGQAAQHTIRATHTCTFVAAKPGFFVPKAEQYTGRVHVLDIGAPRVLVEEMVQYTD